MMGIAVDKSTTSEHVCTILAKYAGLVTSEMAAVLDATVEDGWLRRAIGYQLGWLDEDFEPVAGNGSLGGKKLRPALAVLAYQGASFRPTDPDTADVGAVLPFAVALEFLHNSSLVFDDIQDCDRFRRGRPTLWTLLGEGQALNVGVCLHTLAFHCLARLHGRGLDLVTELAQTSVHLCVGQYRDLAFEQQNGVTFERYMEMIHGKTASLLSCATYGGAVLATDKDGADARDSLTGYADFGRHLGLGFQIRDDILGIWASDDATGKPTGTDIYRRKKSLPVVFAFNATSGNVLERLTCLYSSPAELTPEDRDYICHVLEDCGAASFAQEQAQLQRDLAIAALTAAAGGSDALPHNPFLSVLLQLADFVTSRSF